MIQMQRFAQAFITGFNVVGQPEDFLAGGSSTNTAFVFGSAHERLPFPDQTFHNVISMNIMEHVFDVEVSSSAMPHGMAWHVTKLRFRS